MTFSVSRRIAASTEDVWALLTDTSRWPDWGPSITGVEPAAARPGPAAEPGSGGLAFCSRGKVRTFLGAALPYTVTAFEAGRYWSWSVAGIPATGHRPPGHSAGRRLPRHLHGPVVGAGLPSGVRPGAAADRAPRNRIGTRPAG
ncbi:SRPBCC family protein [Arthrobacter sp. Bi26]|uniref:SRPBCC family protein n=1 Tax=Arthrobacter sp. Bi26 TaxID=2822350 RepID=UPI0033B31593